MAYPRITVNVTGDLVQKQSIMDDEERMSSSVIINQYEEIGELTLSIGMSPQYDEEELFSSEELHQLFVKSGRTHKLSSILLELHPRANEFLTKEFDIDDLDNVSFTIDDFSILRLNGETDKKRETILEAAHSTGNTQNALLEYATLDSKFDDLSFHAKKILKNDLKNN